MALHLRPVLSKALQGPHMQGLAQNLPPAFAGPCICELPQEQSSFRHSIRMAMKDLSFVTSRPLYGNTDMDVHQTRLQT